MGSACKATRQKWPHVILHACLWDKLFFFFLVWPYFMLVKIEMCSVFSLQHRNDALTILCWFRDAPLYHVHSKSEKNLVFLIQISVLLVNSYSLFIRPHTGKFSKGTFEALLWLSAKVTGIMGEPHNRLPWIYGVMEESDHFSVKQLRRV